MLTKREVAYAMFSKLGITCLFLLAVVPATIHAQGAIAGSVKDASGAVLPGVVVTAASPVLIEKTRAVITDGRGEYKVVGLRPGTYSVSFEFPGFAPQKHEGIELKSDFVADVSVNLQLGTATQSVNVQAEVPGLDTQSSTQQSVLTRAIMDNLPTGHSVYANGQLIPGLTLSRPDVGGTTGMQAPSFRVHGSNSGDVALQVDGMLINQNVGNGGAPGIYYNDGMVQETSYQTSAIPAEVSQGGVRVNMIPREGGNQFHGSFLGNGSTSSLQANNVPVGFTKLKAGNRLDNIYDFNGTVGGPIKRDRLWFLTTVRRWGVNEFVANSFNPNGTQALDDNRITSTVLRLTYQINQKNKVSAYYDKNMKWRGHRKDTASLYSLIDDNASVIQKTPLGYSGQVKWVSTLSPKWLLEAGVSQFFLDYTYDYEPNVARDAIATIDIAKSTLTNAAWYLYRSIGARTQVAVSTSYVSGSHNIKIGFQDSFSPSRDEYTMNGDLRVGFNNGVPSVAYLFNTPISVSEDMRADMGIYAQDSWTFHNLTVNAGVRWEWFNSGIQEQSNPAGTWVPARHIDAIPNVTDWRTIVPRLGVSYNLFGKGKTVLKASASKYEQNQGIGLAQSVNPMFLTSQTCTWNAPAGTTPDMMAHGAAIIAASTFTNCTGFNGAVNTHISPDLTRPYSWEYTGMVQQEVTRQFILSAAYYFRPSRNNYGVKNTLVPSDHYTPVSIKNPLTGESMTVYNQFATDRGKIYLALDNYKELNSEYNGVELQATKRFSKAGSFVSTAFTVGRKYGSALGSGTDLNNPNNLINAIGSIDGDTTYQFRVNGYYRLPWNFQLAGNYQHITGTPFDPTYSVGTSVVPGLTQVTQVVRLTKPGSQRLPDLNLMDVRVSRIFMIGERWKIEPVVDAYNLLNVNTPYTAVTTVGPNLGNYSANTEGRFVKFGLKVDF